MFSSIYGFVEYSRRLYRSLLSFGKKVELQFTKPDVEVIDTKLGMMNDISSNESNHQTILWLGRKNSGGQVARTVNEHDNQHYSLPTPQAASLGPSHMNQTSVTTIRLQKLDQCHGLFSLRCLR